MKNAGIILATALGVLALGGGGLAIYQATRPKTVTPPPVVMAPPPTAQTQPSAAGTIDNIANTVGTVANTIDGIVGLFG